MAELMWKEEDVSRVEGTLDVVGVSEKCEGNMLAAWKKKCVGEPVETRKEKVSDDLGWEKP